MIAVDTNILVYAHRRELDKHEAALANLRALAESPRLWAVPVFCLGEWVRVITHPRLFDPPHTPSEANVALSSLLASPSLQVLNPGPRFPALFQSLLTESHVQGNLVFDAQIAALCLEHGVSELLSEDRDFSRFPDIVLRTL